MCYNITHNFSLQDLLQIENLIFNTESNIQTQNFTRIERANFALDISGKQRRILKIRDMAFV